MCGAYDDREAVLDLVRANGPYRLMASLGGYEGFRGLTSPWFRAHWAVDGRELVPGTGALLANERFVAASRAVTAAEIVRPVSVLVNLMCPMASGDVAHVDTALFRGVERGTFPTWLLVVMAASGLFERWRVPTSGAITWFYDGPGGDYEFWPDGPGGAPARERSPFGNVAIVADNDRMYHRVSDVGRREDWLGGGALSQRALLAAADDGGWSVTDEGGAAHHYPAGAVRVSLLWKAVVFWDADEAAAFDGHGDDLTLEQIVAAFCADLAAKGRRTATPSDPFADLGWQRALWDAYPLRPPTG